MSAIGREYVDWGYAALLQDANLCDLQAGIRILRAKLPASHNHKGNHRTILGGLSIKFMSLFGAEMRDVHQSCRIIRKNAQLVANVDLAQALAGLQDGERAQ